MLSTGRGGAGNIRNTMSPSRTASNSIQPVVRICEADKGEEYEREVLARHRDRQMRSANVSSMPFRILPFPSFAYKTLDAYAWTAVTQCPPFVFHLAQMRVAPPQYADYHISRCRLVVAGQAISAMPLHKILDFRQRVLREDRSLRYGRGTLLFMRCISDHSG